MSSDGATSIRQTTVDSIVELALNTVDKPELFGSDPSKSLQRMMERYGDEPIELALIRCRELLKVNPNDFTAAGAVRFLENALSG
jgi:hypothetical protein